MQLNWAGGITSFFEGRRIFDNLFKRIYHLYNRKMSKRLTSQLTGEMFTKGGLFRAASNFLEYKSLRRAAVIVIPTLLATALVSTSLLVRCGDIELNPGPLSKEGK